MKRGLNKIRAGWMAIPVSITFATVMLWGCGAGDGGHDHDDHAADAQEPITNRVDIPPMVRRNLGITFAKVERRLVRSTVRLPGQFELRPKARREYHVMLSGRVELLVEQYQRVAPGDVLFHLDSPEWRRVQEDLAYAYKACFCCRPEVDVAAAALAETRKAAEFLESRIENLAGANVRRVELEAELAKLRNTLPRLEAELEAKQADQKSAEMIYDVTLAKASSVTGIPCEKLDEPVGGLEGEAEEIAYWRTIALLTIRAEAAGIVDNISVTNRGWAEAGDLVLDTLDPTAVRFHADALQTDVNLFHDGQPAKIVPPPGGSIDLQESIDGTLTVGFRAHPEQRTIPIYMVPGDLPRWAKAGVTAYLEVFVDGSDEPELAIPESCVIRDGLDLIFFRRNPHNADEVIRVNADLGASDRRWVVVNSGVKAGDEVVLDGVYPLMLASSASGAAPAAGHFHADGTFHEEPDH